MNNGYIYNMETPETRSDKNVRRLVASLFSFFITMSFYGWTGPLHEGDPWNTLFYTIAMAYVVYTYVSNSIEKERLRDLAKKAKSEKDGEAA